MRQLQLRCDVNKYRLLLMSGVVAFLVVFGLTMAYITKGEDEARKTRSDATKQQNVEIKDLQEVLCHVQRVNRQQSVTIREVRRINVIQSELIKALQDKFPGEFKIKTPPPTDYDNGISF